MRVAIMGCGLSGMSTALFLQRQGIKADIYESLDTFADFPSRAEVLMNVYIKPVTNIPGYIRRNFALTLNYHAPLNRIVWHAANASATAVGKLGTITLRGREKGSLDQQLADEVKCNIKFGVTKAVEDLTGYDWVINASGQADGQRSGTRSYCFRGGTIKGKFDPNTMHIWHTTAATPKGYAYLLPRSSELANLFLVIPLDQSESSDRYFLHLWQLLPRDLGFEPELNNEEEFRRILSDHLPSVSEGLLQVGNSLGTATPYLGIDQFFALSTSYLAARKVTGRPFPRRLPSLTAHLNTMQVIRRSMDTWGDFVYDNLVRMMRIGATPFFVSKRNLLSATSFILRPYAGLVASQKLANS